MKQIEVTDVDSARVGVLMTALKRGKWELEGEEILAFAQVFSWAAELQGRLKAAKEPEPLAPVAEIKPKKRAKDD